MEKISLLFPGQGSQVVGMGKALYAGSEKIREIFEEANDTLGFDLKKLCFEGDLKELTSTENAQPAILTVSFAYYTHYMELVGKTPAFAAGHSLGEYSALAASGVLKFSDAIQLVRKRGLLMKEAGARGGGSMAAVKGIDRETIAGECAKVSSPEELAVVSNHNSAAQIVISGHAKAVESAADALKEKGAIVTPLRVSAAFHSPLMEPVAAKLKKELEACVFADFNFPVISNVTAIPYKGKDEIVKNLVDQVVNPVMWYDSMQYLKQQGVTTVIEIGPKTVLKNLMRDNVADIKAFAFDKDKDRETIMQELAERESVDTGALSVVTRCMAVAVCTRNRNWDNDAYAKGVVEPYKQIQQMQEELESRKEKPTVEQMQKALSMLKSVFETKLVPVEEQIERFNQIFDETGTRELFPEFRMPEIN